MSNLQLFAHDGIEILIDTTTSESFCSVKGYARMSKKDKSTISRRLQGVASSKQKTTEIVTGGGLQRVVLISENLIAQWLPKDNPEMASKLMLLGVRMFLHELAGYKVACRGDIAEEAQALPIVQPPQPALPPADVRISNLTKALNFLGIDASNPRWNQALQDLTGDILGINQPLLPSTEPHQKWAGVVEIAEEMGYRCAVDLGVRSQLGKYVSQHTCGISIIRKKEKRLCNGTQREIWVYRDCQKLRGIIASFFNGVAV